MINYQQELNEEQLRAVQEGDGPCLVLAGAGSGKTRVITYRVAYLLEQGVALENILLVTFTNKAAGEMMNRVQGLTGSDRRLPWAGTFHHIANKILRVYAPLLDYKNNFTVLDTDDSESLIKLCSKNFRESPQSNSGQAAGQRFPSASVLLNLISFSRNAETTMEDALELKYPYGFQFLEAIKSIAVEYENKKKEANAMDFDDMLVNLLKLLEREPQATATPPSPLLERGGGERFPPPAEGGALEKYAQQFKYILVDEYQDTNKIQASIIDRLAVVHKNIFVVGDDAQSIYSFRAADVGNILNFEKKYPTAKIFKLETNYRSTQEILDLANGVIANNPKQYKKHLRTMRPGSDKPALFPAMDAGSEAEFIAREIKKCLDNNVNPAEIAVLFRAAHHSQNLEMELMRRGISYDYRGGVRFFERAHVKDVLSYLRLVNNLADTAAWLRVLMKEEGIGPAGARKVIAEIKAIKNVEEVKDTGWRVLGEKAKNGWNKFVGIWERMLGANKKPAELISSVVDSSYKNYLEDEYLDSKERMIDLKQLAEFAKKYDNLEDFLSESALQEGFRAVASATPPYPLLERGGGERSPSVPMQGRDPDPRVGTREGATPTGSGGVGGKIILSTIHQAKGLEWEKVFVMNLSNGGFPNDRALREDGGLEEERRLFYVAITRAKRSLLLTYPMAGLAGEMLAGPSLFLAEISEGLLDDHSLLSTDNLTVYDDPDADVTYISETPLKIKPGPPSSRQGRDFGEARSFLRDIDDL